MVGWVFSRDMPKGGIGEDHIGWNGPLVGNLSPQLSELFKQFLITLNFAGEPGAFLLNGLLGEVNGGSIFQGGASLVGEVEDVHAFGVLAKIAQANELPADGLPFLA